jgi:hypothetical protein
MKTKYVGSLTCCDCKYRNKAITSSYSNFSDQGRYFLPARFSQGSEIDRSTPPRTVLRGSAARWTKSDLPKRARYFVRATGRMTRIMGQQIDRMWVSILVVALSDLHTNVFRRAIKRERHH